MDGLLLAALILFGAAMCFTPGPNVVMITASAANFGFRRALPHMLSIAIGVLAAFSDPHDNMLLETTVTGGNLLSVGGALGGLGHGRRTFPQPPAGAPGLQWRHGGPPVDLAHSRLLVSRLGRLGDHAISHA
jgi:hypothetical protein